MESSAEVKYSGTNLRKLDTRGGVRISADAGGIDGIGLLDRADNLPINGESQRLGLPVDL